MSKKAAFGFWYVLMALWGIAILHTLTKQPSEKVEQIPYSQFETYLDEGRIEEVRVASSYIEGNVGVVVEKGRRRHHPRQLATNCNEHSSDRGCRRRTPCAEIARGNC